MTTASEIAVGINAAFPGSLQGDVVRKINNRITAGGAFTPTAKPTALTDSSTGTPGATLAAITSTTPADLTAVGVQLGIIKNAVASLNAQINSVVTQLVASGILTA